VVLGANGNKPQQGGRKRDVDQGWGKTSKGDTGGRGGHVKRKAEWLVHYRMCDGEWGAAPGHGCAEDGWGQSGGGERERRQGQGGCSHVEQGQGDCSHFDGVRVMCTDLARCCSAKLAGSRYCLGRTLISLHQRSLDGAVTCFFPPSLCCFN
jgi:hypothetical protein